MRVCTILKKDGSLPTFRVLKTSPQSTPLIQNKIKISRGEKKYYFNSIDKIVLLSPKKKYKYKI